VALFNPTALSPNDVPPATANINNTVRRQKLIQALGWIRGNNFPSLVTNLSNNGSAPGAQTLGASSSQPYANSTSNDVHDRHADKSSSPPRKRARQNSSFRLDTLHFKSLTDIPK
jgi:hypothetical protein